jgi:MFS family permease
VSTRELLGIRDARLYVAGQAFSIAGDSALWLAAAIWVKTLTGSNGAAGLVFFFFTAPALLAPLFGLVIDRLRRRPLLIVTNLIAAGVVLLLLFVHGAGQVWLIYLVMVLYGLAHSVITAAQTALLTVMVPDELLPDANGLLRTIQETLNLVAPLAGAGLFVLLGAHTVAMADAATFTVPVICLAALRVREPAPHPRGQHWLSEVTAGVRHIGRTIALRQLVIGSACALLVLGFGETIIFAIAGEGLHRPPAFVGVLVAIQGAGAVLGGPTAAPLLRRAGEARLVGIGLLVGAAAAVVVMVPILPVVAAGIALFGVCIPWIVVGFTTLIQRRTPPELQGRVYSAADALVTTPQTISIALGAALIGVAGYRTLLGAMAAVLFLAAAYLLTRPESRPARHQPRSRQPEARTAGPEPRESQPAAGGPPPQDYQPNAPGGQASPALAVDAPPTA